MVYASPFWRLVVIGDLYADVFNFSMSFIGGTGALGPVTPAHLAALADVLQPWFGSNVQNQGPQLVSSARMTSFKLNRIGVDGKYMDPDPQEHVFPFPVPGGASGAAGTVPAQVSAAVTLRSNVSKGRASRGRFYLPAPAAAQRLGTDGRFLVQDAASMAQASATFLEDARDALHNAGGGGLSPIPFPGIVSNIGAGTQRLVWDTAVGRVPDTIRSRRNKLDEDPEVAPVVGQ